MAKKSLRQRSFEFQEKKDPVTQFFDPDFDYNNLSSTGMSLMLW